MKQEGITFIELLAAMFISVLLSLGTIWCVQSYHKASQKLLAHQLLSLIETCKHRAIYQQRTVKFCLTEAKSGVKLDNQFYPIKGLNKATIHTQSGNCFSFAPNNRLNARGHILSGGFKIIINDKGRARIELI